jgi:hypothetical protein
MATSRITLCASLFFTVIFSMTFVGNLIAQREYIVIEKTLSNKQITYSSGDEISYKLKGEDFFRTDHIIALNDTAIEFHYNLITFREIAEVNIKGKRFSTFNFKSVGTYAQVAGLGYIAIDQFNQVVVGGEDASFNETVWLAGGLIFVGGTILKMLTPKKVKVGGKYRIRYMNLTPY